MVIPLMLFAQAFTYPIGVSRLLVKESRENGVRVIRDGEFDGEAAREKGSWRKELKNLGGILLQKGKARVSEEGALGKLGHSQITAQSRDWLSEYNPKTFPHSATRTRAPFVQWRNVFMTRKKEDQGEMVAMLRGSIAHQAVNASDSSSQTTKNPCTV